MTAPADPTKTGYTFDGWEDEEGNSVTIPATMPAADLTVEAKWTINTYTITFVTDGGTEIAPITDVYNTPVTAPANPVKEGYTFDGWDKEIPSTIPAEDMVITAKWTINSYKITFLDENGEVIKELAQNYGTAVAAPTREKTGYTFAGWVNSNNEKVDVPATMPAQNMTLKETWRINQ